LLHRSYDGVEDDIACARSCISFLTWCSSSESVAGRYLKIIQPLYDALLAITSAMLSKSTNSADHCPTGDQSMGHKGVEAQVQWTTADAVATSTLDLYQVVTASRRLLLDPFGSAQNGKENGFMMLPSDPISSRMSW